MSAIFNAANKLRHYDVSIGGISLVKECIISFEAAYHNNTPVVPGRLVFNDLYDMNRQVVWRDTTVKVYYMDIFDQSATKEFVVTGVNESSDTMGHKTLILSLQDKFSFVLQHCYLTKSFNSDPGTILNSYVSQLGLDQITGYSADMSSISGNVAVVVPKSTNTLDYLLTEFYKRGYSWYQTKKNTTVIKYIDDIVPSSLPENDPGKPYKNETDNQLYKNKIIDIKTSFMNLDKIEPTTTAVAFDPSTKSVLKSGVSDVTSLSLSNDTVDLQSKFYTGNREVFQSTTNFDHQRMITKDSLMKQSEVQIVVNGYVKNDLNQLYELELRGNVSTADSQAKGNMVNNGKYVSSVVVDKMVGDTLIQKIHLGRADLQQAK